LKIDKVTGARTHQLFRSKQVLSHLAAEILVAFLSGTMLLTLSSFVSFHVNAE
jgi:hypothetical protein